MILFLWTILIHYLPPPLNICILTFPVICLLEKAMMKASENYQHRRQDDPVFASGPLFHTRTGENKRSADLVSMCYISLLAPQGALYFKVRHCKSCKAL